MEKVLENPVVVRMLQSVLYQTMMDKVNEDKDYLNECSIDEFVKISELIRDDDDFNIKIIKDLVYNIVYRTDLRPISNMVLGNLCYYLEKFSETDYKYQEYMINFLIKDYKLEVGNFNKFLLKYALDLLRSNSKKFKPENDLSELDFIND